MTFSVSFPSWTSVVQRIGWDALDLSHRFLLLSGLLVTASLTVLGAWTTSKIEAAITSDVGVRAAGVIESALAPFTVELAEGTLSSSSVAALDRDLGALAERLRVIEVKIWDLDGRIIYGSDPLKVGLSFPIDGLLASAISGDVAVGTDDMVQTDEGLTDIFPAVNVFEIYVPIRRDGSPEVVAVGEFYQDAEIMSEALTKARWETWSVVAFVSLALVAGLYQVVAQGNEVIERQKASLRDRVADLTGLLDANEMLRARIQAASSRTSEDIEGHLRRVGSDIHDGIGQLLTIALLRLDEALPDPASQNESFRAVRDTLADAMAEVREMAAGLSLPLMQAIPLDDAVGTVVLRHRRHTSTQAKVMIARGIPEPSHAVKLAICRFVQEGLSNAFKHAAGQGQRVEIEWDPPMITVSVSDSGPGDAAPRVAREGRTLGLAGLRNRVESMGGQFEIERSAGRGTTVKARFPILI